MAVIKNFGVSGVGSNLQLGKYGPRIIGSPGAITIRNYADTTDAVLVASSATLSAGDLTFISANSMINIIDASISRHSSAVLKFDGTSAVMAPVGTTATRPTGQVGMLRVNNDVPAVSYAEIWAGSEWYPLITAITAINQATSLIKTQRIYAQLVLRTQ